MNRKAKGKRGELELAAKLREYGFTSRRGVQYNGADGSADVIGLPGIHIEVKRVEKLNICEAVKQAQGDAKEGEMPAVFHRKNWEQWLVTMSLSDWIALYQAKQE